MPASVFVPRSTHAASEARAAADINRVRFRPSFDYEGIDTLRFNDPTAVPEPASVLLTVAGLAGMVTLNRKRNRRRTSDTKYLQA